MWHNKGRKLPPEILTDAEVQALLRVCNRRYLIGCRTRALIGLLYRSGLRISEALSLRLCDVDLAAGTVRVLHGKGDKSRTVGVDAGACELIATWIQFRAKKFVVSPWLFCTGSGKQVDPCSIRHLIRRKGIKAGICKRVHAHGLRHTHAAQLCRENMPINEISVQLGHSSAATTARYLQHIAPEQVISKVRAREWRAAGQRGVE